MIVPSRDSKSEERLAKSIGEAENTVLPRASCQSADGRVQVVDDLSCFGTDTGLYGLHVFLARCWSRSRSCFSPRLDERGAFLREVGRRLSCRARHAKVLMIEYRSSILVVVLERTQSCTGFICFGRVSGAIGVGCVIVVVVVVVSSQGAEERHHDYHDAIVIKNFFFVLH